MKRELLKKTAVKKSNKYKKVFTLKKTNQAKKVNGEVNV